NQKREICCLPVWVGPLRWAAIPPEEGTIVSFGTDLSDARGSRALHSRLLRGGIAFSYDIHRESWSGDRVPTGWSKWVNRETGHTTLRRSNYQCSSNTRAIASSKARSPGIVSSLLN